MSASPPVTIVINTLNRAAHLEDALRAVAALDYPELEIVVVNGPSTDGTEAVLAQWSDRIKLGLCPEANLARSRNIGIGLAAGEIIGFIDDDAAPHPQWLRRLVPGFSDPQVGALGGFTIDNTGVRWQVKKTVCDRFGTAFAVSEHFDERPLSRPGSPYYPSLLGTNAAFRASALRGIGGFDHTFAYLLDETDVCLRLADAGWKVAYEPTALVFHQFAASHIRSPERTARTLYPSAVSKGYFAMRHGADQSVEQAGAALDAYRRDILQSNAWLEKHGRITAEHRFSLDQDLLQGVRDGVAAAMDRRASGGDLAPGAPPAFRPLDRPPRLRLAMVSHGFPPTNETGIARWTALAARGLSDLGHEVHVLTAADAGQDETVRFEGGLWLHRLKPLAEGDGPVAETHDVPPHIAAWSARVAREAQSLKSFGVEVVSFPIWDLEGLPVLDDPDMASVVSLHTTYAMAKPFKPDWSERPLYGAYVVDRVIAAERALLERAPALIANSGAVVAQIETAYGLDIAGRCLEVPHGTADPLVLRAGRAAERDAAVRSGAPLRVLFVGRFEPRKGFDIAADVAARVIEALPGAEVWFVGDHLNDQRRRELADLGLESLLDSPRVRFLGQAHREALDDLYVDCDLTLAPSRFESFGLVAIEAMAAGRPVLAAAAGGLAEVVRDEEGGRAFAVDDSLAARMAEQVLAFDRDREALLAMGARARQVFEAGYTVELMARRLADAYRDAAAGQREAKP